MHKVEANASTGGVTDPLVDGTRAVDLVAVLTARGETVATAESLTAGLLTATIAGVPGASNVLRGGLVVYATDLKATLAGVDPPDWRRTGPWRRPRHAHSRTGHAPAAAPTGASD